MEVFISSFLISVQCSHVFLFVCLFVLFSMYAIVSCCMSSFSLSLFPSALLWYCHVSLFVCLFIFLCHGFVILLLVFHIITSWTVCVLKELIFQFRGLTTFQIPAPQKRRRTTYPRDPHDQRRKMHHRSHGIWLLFFSAHALSGCQAEGWVCFQAMHLHQGGLSVSETFSLLFYLLPLISIRLYYIVLSCIPISVSKVSFPP